MKFSKLLSVLTLLLSGQAMALDATSLKLTVYSVMLSTSSLCTNPVTIFSSTVPVEVDFLATPTLGSGNPADGTYNCVIIKMSDLIKFKPSATTANCSGVTEYTADVCRTDNAGSTRAPDAGGAATACTGNATTPLSDPVYLYLTTNASAGTGGGSTFLQPTTVGSANGLNLTAPLVISGTARSKFVVNATGKVIDSGTECGLNPPVFGFQKM